MERQHDSFELLDQLKNLVNVTDEQQKNIIEEGITTESVKHLSEEDLKILGFKMGSRKIILANFTSLRESHVTGLSESCVATSIQPDSETVPAGANNPPGSTSSDSSTNTSEKHFDVISILSNSPRGREITTSLQEGKHLSRVDRIMMIKLLGNYLMATSEKLNMPTKKEKISMAKSLIIEFPILKGSGTTNGWELYYDPIAHTGFLETYIRTKRSRDPTISRIPKKRKLCISSSSNNTDHQKEDELERYMRTIRPSVENRSLILDALEQTRVRRRAWIMAENPTAGVILKRYPRFQDMNECLREEFISTSESYSSLRDEWPKYEQKVLKLAKLKFANNEEVSSMLQEQEMQYNEGTTCKTALRLLSYILPAKPKRGVKKSVVNPKHCSGLLLLEVPAHLSIHEAIELANEHGMKQPGLIELGAQYFVLVDGVLIPLAVGQLIEAVELLVMIFYVFNLAYPEELKCVYGLLEAICGMNLSVNNSPTIYETLTQLK